MPRATHRPPASTRFPSEPTPFMGRVVERATIEDTIRRGERLLVLLGISGMGKTRLAIEAAQAALRSGLAQEFVYCP